MKLNNDLFDKLRKASAVVLVGATLFSVSPAVKASSNDKVVSIEVDDTDVNYIKDDKSGTAIKTDGKTSKEIFAEKAKFLLGEETYNNQYLNEENTVELRNNFDAMYGEGAFDKLKEYEYLTSGLSKMQLNFENINANLALWHVSKDLTVFKDSKNKDYMQNEKDSLNIRINSIKKAMDNEDDMYTTIYKLNEFTSACLANAYLNGKIDSFDNIWETYKNEILNPIVTFDNEQVIDISTTSYPILNEIENDSTYNRNIESTIQHYNLSK